MMKTISATTSATGVITKSSDIYIYGADPVAMLAVQSFTKYLRQTLVFMGNSKIRKTLISLFWQFFASINKISILGGGLETKL